MSLRNVLLKMGVLDLNTQRMDYLVDESNEKMICWAFENGRYDVRRIAVDYFSKHATSKSLHFLRLAMNDEIEVISQEAMIGLESCDHSVETIQEIADKRQFWKVENAYKEERRNRVHLKSSVLTESKERGSKKSLDNARNMLKKPMLGGKWF